MTKRSTRNKIRHQADVISEKLDEIIAHLAAMEELAAGRSEVIGSNLPVFVLGFSKLKEAWTEFSNGL